MVGMGGGGGIEERRLGVVREREARTPILLAFEKSMFYEKKNNYSFDLFFVVVVGVCFRVGGGVLFSHNDDQKEKKKKTKKTKEK